MEDAIGEIALLIVRELPALGVFIFLIVVGLVVWIRISPAIISYYSTRSDIEEKREIRKQEEAQKRSLMEGQWLSAMGQANENSAEQNKLSRKLVDKFDRDMEQSKRLEDMICDVHRDMKELSGFLKR